MPKSLKERFEEYVFIDPAIERLEHKINEAYGTYFKCTVQSSNGPGYTKINESVGGYDLSSAQERIADMRAEVERLGHIKEEIESLVDSISDLKMRQIMSLRFLDGERWCDVAAKLGHSVSENSCRVAAKRFFDSCSECSLCSDSA